MLFLVLLLLLLPFCFEISNRQVVQKDGSRVRSYYPGCVLDRILPRGGGRVSHSTGKGGWVLKDQLKAWQFEKLSLY